MEISKINIATISATKKSGKMTLFFNEVFIVDSSCWHQGRIFEFRSDLTAAENCISYYSVTSSA